MIFLGRIIELLSGDDYEVYVTKNILMPLGMHATFFDRAPYLLMPHRSHSYMRTDGRPDGGAVRFRHRHHRVERRPERAARRHGEVYGLPDGAIDRTPVYDVVLKRASLEEMWKPADPRLGWRRRERRRRRRPACRSFSSATSGLDFIAHSGDQNGFISHSVPAPSVPDRVHGFVQHRRIGIEDERLAPTTRQVDAALREQSSVR